MPDDEDEEILTVFTEEELKSKARLEKDKEKIEGLKYNPITNKINFIIFDLGQYFENRTTKNHFSDMKEKLFADIHRFQPTAIILTHLSIKSTNSGGGGKDIAGEINNKEGYGKLLKLDGMDGFIGSDLLKELRKSKSSIWQNEGLIFANQNFLMFRTRNMFQTNKTLLTSNTRTTTSGITESIPVLLDYVKRWVGAKLIRILMFSGSHGNLIDGISAILVVITREGRNAIYEIPMTSREHEYP